jgi:hypothetical protein
VVGAGLLALAALVQNGYPAHDTMLDCSLKADEKSSSGLEAEVEALRRVAILLARAGQRAEDAPAYKTKGVNTGWGSRRIAYRWPLSFTIEEHRALEGPHREYYGRGETSLRIGRIDERAGRAHLTLVEHKDYENGRIVHQVATGTCRLIRGPAATRLFEEFSE